MNSLSRSLPGFLCLASVIITRTHRFESRWNATSGRVLQADAARRRPEVAVHLFVDEASCLVVPPTRLEASSTKMPFFSRFSLCSS
jgi:hypothetical protein